MTRKYTIPYKYYHNSAPIKFAEIKSWRGLLKKAAWRYVCHAPVKTWVCSGVKKRVESGASTNGAGI